VQHFSFTREFDRPDFCTQKDGFPVGIEAVTVNHSVSHQLPDPENPDELQLLRHEFMPIRFGSALFSKIQKRYAANLLALGVASSNTNLLPLAGIVLGGSSANRTVQVTPALGQSGTAFVTLVVMNPAGLTAGSTFLVSVTNSTVAGLASGIWMADLSGNWSDPANWSGGRFQQQHQHQLKRII
jgi:hypothetical protein